MQLLKFLKKMIRHSLLLILVSGLSKGQYSENITYGLKLGALHSRITNLPEMLIGRENNRQQFDINGKGVFGVEGGLFFNYKFPDTRVAIQPELLYRYSGAEVNYNNETTGSSYKLGLRYSYLMLGGIYKVYPYAGLNIGIGAYYSKILTPHGVSYESNDRGGLYDASHRQFYREGIVGKDDFSLSFSLGYELEDNFHFDLRYYLGVGDMIGNRSTSFQFLENANRNSYLSLSVGYSFHNW